MGSTGEQIRLALESDPALTLLKAYSSSWVLPLFAEHLEPAVGAVSAQWFHEKVDEAREISKARSSTVSAGEYCREWADKRWLETEAAEGALYYRLSSHSLRALRMVREVTETSSSVSGARLGSIAHAVHSLADMTNPDRDVYVSRLDDQIEQLQAHRAAAVSGEVRLSSVEEMQQQLDELLAMTRSLPADFRQLRSMVEDRHQQIARYTLEAGPPKAELVEQYLRDNDLLSQTAQGAAYSGFSRLLASQQTDQMRADVDTILAQDFAQQMMTPAQREELESMLSTLMGAELEVQSSYVKWSASLRRLLTRAGHVRHRRMLELADEALAAGADWVEAEPGARWVNEDFLRVGVLAAVDLSQTQLVSDPVEEDVQVTAEVSDRELPEADRQSMVLAASTSPAAVAEQVNKVWQRAGGVVGTEVNGADVFAALPADYQRLGALVSLLDVAVAHGSIDAEHPVNVQLTDQHQLVAQLPNVVFESAIPDDDEVVGH